MKRLILLLTLVVGAFAQQPGNTVVPVSGATPILTANSGVTNFTWTLSASVGSSTFSSPSIGNGTLRLCENGTGGFTVAFPANFIGFQNLTSTAANYCQPYSWQYDGTNVNCVGGFCTGTAPISSGGTAATTAAAGTMPNATSGTAASWTATPTLGASGTLGSLTMGNATSGTLVVEPVTGALGNTTMLIPAAVGLGTLTQTIASGTSAMGTTSIASGACATVVTTAASGVVSTDTITWAPNVSVKALTGFTPATTGGLTITAYPTANNVNFDECNWSTGSITPSALTLNWRVAR